MAVFDLGLKDRILDELEKLALSDEPIELWFLNPVSEVFGRYCFFISRLFKSRNPNKDIKIVLVLDPVKDDSDHLTWIEKQCPQYSVDKIIYSKYMGDGHAKIKSHIGQQREKVERWMMRQCDYVFAYYYPILHDSINYTIKGAHIRPHITVIPLYFEDTSQLIQEELAMFDDRTRRIYYLLNDEGMSQADVAKANNISHKRISQITQKTASYIYGDLKRLYHKQIKQGMKSRSNIKICGLAHLNDNPSESQITLFKSLIKYLMNVYVITEFWMDKKSCKTPYSTALLECVNIASKPILSKVFLSLEEDSVDEWDRAIDEYVPPFSGTVGISYSEGEPYKSVIKESTCFITDFSCAGSNLIREFCGQDGNTYLFDVSKNRLNIDEQYMD